MSKLVIPKTKEQLKDFINEIIAGKISTRGKTKHNEKRLKQCKNHLDNRDKDLAREDHALVICVLLRILRDTYRDDEILQDYILILTSMSQALTTKLMYYKQKNEQQ